MATSGLGELLADGRRNAAASWLLVGIAAAAWFGGVIVAGPLWSVFALAIVALAVLPPIVYRSRYVMLPWEVLAMAVLPLIGLAIGAHQLTGPLFAYLAIAAVGLVIVVELDSFTSVRMSPAFALVLVVAATMAASATWELLQWYASMLLDRSYDTTNDELMIEFVYATLAGFGAGGLFWAYFRRVSLGERVPVEVQDQVEQSRAGDGSAGSTQNSGANGGEDAAEVNDDV